MNTLTYLATDIDNAHYKEVLITRSEALSEWVFVVWEERFILDFGLGNLDC